MEIDGGVFVALPLATPRPVRDMGPGDKRPRPRGAVASAAPERVDEFARRGDYAGALELLDGMLQANPGRPELMYRRAALLLAMQRRQEAVLAFRDLLRLVPGDARALNGLGGALASTGEFAEAAQAFTQACERDPRRVDYRFNLARSLLDAGDAAAACAACEQVIRLRPQDVDARVAHANCLGTLGRLDAAAAEFRQVLRSQPDCVPAWSGLVGLKTIRLDEAELARLGALHESIDAQDVRRTALGFAYGQALESAGRYPRAFDVLVESNAARAKNVSWHVSELDDYVASAMSASRNGLAKASDRELGREVIFLVGMPRSGSTLVEQVLGAHPDVAGAGELLDAHAVLSAESARRGKELFAWAPEADAAEWAALGRDYLARTAHWRGSHAVFTDKQLDNWRYVGILHAMLPAARFIHCRRDPLETCWSCFKHDFYRGQAAFTYDFGHLARYWHDSMHLMRFWSEQHPGLVFEQVHEDFVAQPEAGVRRLLHYCGLDFHEACLRFHEADRVVRTASAGQVRQPISRGMAVALRYGELLDPLREALGI